MDKENAKIALNERLRQLAEDRQKHLQQLVEKRASASEERPAKIDWFRQRVMLVVKGGECRRLLPPCLRLFRLHQVEKLLSEYPVNLPLIKAMLACMAADGQPARHNLRFDPRYQALKQRYDLLEQAASVDWEAAEMEAPKPTLSLPTTSSLEAITADDEDQADLDEEAELAAEVEAISQRLQLQITPPERTKQRRLVQNLASELREVLTPTRQTMPIPLVGGSMIKLVSRTPTQKQRLEMDAQALISPVRRSVRLNKGEDGNQELPAGSDWAYLPNPHLPSK